MTLAAAVINYNGAPYLKGCLESVLDQSHPLDDVLVLDNRSTDRSVPLLRESHHQDGRRRRATLVGSALGAAALWLVVGWALGSAQAVAQTSAPREVTVEGSWRSGDTTIRISVKGSEARAVFAIVGERARSLGFKPGERSFEATIDRTFLYGRRLVRYGGSCYLTGRQVPMMGRLSPDGRVLAIHFYSVTLDQNCRDTGQYNVTETLWERVPEGGTTSPQRPGAAPSR